MAKGPRKLLDPELLEKVRRAIALPPEQAEALRKPTLPPGVHEALRKLAWTPEQLERFRKLAGSPEQLEALRRKFEQDDSVDERAEEPPGPVDEWAEDLEALTAQLEALSQVRLPSGSVDEWVKALSGSIDENEEVDRLQERPPELDAGRRVDPQHPRKPSPEQVRAKLGSRAEALRSYETMLQLYSPDGDPRGIPRKDVCKAVGDKLGRARPISPSTLARVLRALRGC